MNGRTPSVCVLVVVVVAALTAGSRIHLQKLSTLYLPFTYLDGVPQYALGKSAAEQAAYDAEDKVVYVVGDNTIHVINVKSAKFPYIVYHISIPDVDITDVELCGEYVAVAMDNTTHRDNGQVVLYRKFKMGEFAMETVHSISVGALPDMIKVTADCKKILVAVEAEAYFQNGEFHDPEGAVGIIEFQSANWSTPYTYTSLDFRKFNDRWQELEKGGARFVFRERNNTFAQDLEPEYIAFNWDETLAYVVLQENNAIAEVDLTTNNITRIMPLGLKKWENYQMDASDRDNAIRLKKWPVYGMYQPDSASTVRWKNVDYILMANEGDSKDYPDIGWSEESRVRDLVLTNRSHAEVNIDEYFNNIEELQKVENLGRLKVSNQNGRLPGSDEFYALYAFGGRSFSIRTSANMELVYDSGDDIERMQFEHLSNIFNMNPSKRTSQANATWDTRSDDKGPECESITSGKLGSKLVIFVGNERPGTISVYSVDDDIAKPKYESTWSGISAQDGTWEELYERRQVSELDPEDMRFITADDSPSDHPLLLVCGSNSGNLAVFEVKEIEDQPGVSTVLPSTSGASTSRGWCIFFLPLLLIASAQVICLR